MTSLITAALVLAAPIQVQRLQSFDTIKTIALQGAPTGALFAASLENGNVRIMNAATKQTLTTLTGHPQPVYGLGFTPNGQQLVTGDETSRIWVWDVKTGKKLREFPRGQQYHSRGIQSIQFSKDGKTLVTTGKDDMIILWDFASMKVKAKILGKGVIFANATLTGSGMVVATMTQGLQFRKADGTTVTQSDAHGGLGINELAVNPSGTRAITAGRDNSLGIWDLKTRKLAGKIKAHDDWVVRTAISPNGRLAATSSSDRNVNIFDLASMKRVATLPDQCAVGSPLTFTGDGRFLLSVDLNDGLQINAVTPAQSAAPATTRRRR